MSFIKGDLIIMECKIGNCLKKKNNCCLVCEEIEICITEWKRACNETGEIPSLCTQFDLINNPSECKMFNQMR